MNYPKINIPAASRTVVSAFGGYHPVPEAEPGQWQEECNLSSELWPLLSQRGGRSRGPATGSTSGIWAGESLCWVRGGSGRLYVDGRATGLLLDPSTEKQFVAMGALLLIFPDKVYFNTADPEDYGPLEAKTQTKGRVTYSLCNEDGEDYGFYALGPSAPESPQAGSLWLDSSQTPGALKRYGGDPAGWTEITATYVKLRAEGIGAPFQVGDGVTLSGCDADPQDTALQPQARALNGTHVVAARGRDWLVVPGLLDAAFISASTVTAERTLPELDFVVQAGNRLWGCRYGPGPDGMVNTLYASKLGDPKNWQVFQGLSTDSWYVGVGSSGPFTGVGEYGGNPLLFKENVVHKVYISPTGSHQVVTSGCYGVKAGCHGSLAVVGEVLYYASPQGICGYSGSSPWLVSGDLVGLSLSQVRAHSWGSCYVLSALDGAGEPVTLVYDTRRGLWHKEDPMQAVSYATLGDTLYWQDREGDLWAAARRGHPNPGLWQPTGQEDLQWQAVTGALGLALPDNKYLSRLRLRLEPEEGSRVEVSLSYDSSGLWHTKAVLTGPGLRSITIPVLPRRCDHLRIRLRGTGPCRLYTLSFYWEEGSDIDL